MLQVIVFSYITSNSKYRSVKHLWLFAQQHLQLQQHLRCFSVGNQLVSRTVSSTCHPQRRRPQQHSVWLSAYLTFCPSAWSCSKQDVATWAISSYSCGSSEEARHPWPWKLEFLLWWHVYVWFVFCVLFFFPSFLWVLCCFRLQVFAVATTWKLVF